jgi:hypothetical protein
VHVFWKDMVFSFVAFPSHLNQKTFHSQRSFNRSKRISLKVNQNRIQENTG